MGKREGKDRGQGKAKATSKPETKTPEVTPETGTPEVTPETGKKEVTLDDLRGLAKEMNRIMKPNPLIDLNAKEDDLKVIILDLAKELEPTDFRADDDSFTDEDIITMEAIGIVIPKTAPAKRTKSAAKPATARSAKYSRAHSFREALDDAPEGLTIEALASEANALYVAKGGTDNLKQSRHTIDVYLPALVIFGSVVVNDGKISLAWGDIVPAPETEEAPAEA